MMILDKYKPTRKDGGKDVKALREIPGKLRTRCWSDYHLQGTSSHVLPCSCKLGNITLWYTMEWSQNTPKREKEGKRDKTNFVHTRIKSICGGYQHNPRDCPMLWRRWQWYYQTL